MTLIGITLIILGIAGITPSVALFGGDQFKLPDQNEQLQCYFLMFYFMINAGQFISALLTPILRHIHCFDAQDCFPAAFGFPTFMIFLAISIKLLFYLCLVNNRIFFILSVIFLSGYRIYIMNTPKINMILTLIECIIVSIRFYILIN